ncbi:hypothetical protein FOZ63_019572, partial [Perkinsus olseni]
TWRSVKVNIEDHVIMHAACPDNKALEEEINDVQSLVISHALDLTKPAWEVHMLPVTDGDDCIIFRSHHSIGDGLSLITAYESMATNADGSPAKIVPGKKPSSSPRNSFIVAILMAIEYVRSFIVLLWACYMPLESSFSFNTSREHRAGDMRWSGSRRAVLFKPFSLDYVRAITKKTPKKTTINDVLLSATVGAIKAYSGDTVDSNTVMRMLLPFGFEAKLDDMPATDRLTNGFSFCSSDLSKSIRANDSESRLMITSKAMNRVKHSLEAQVSFWMMNQLFARAPIGFYQKTARKVFANHTAIFSNVKGPTTSLYFAGKDVTGSQAMFCNAIPQVTLVSYNGEIYYNITLDPKVVKDWDKLEGLFRQELVAMGEAVGVDSSLTLSRSFNTEDVRKVVNEARQLCPDVTRPTCRMSKRTELEMNRVYPSEYAIASLQQHKARNVFNECPAGHYLLPVSETNAGRGFFRQSLYVDPEDGCRLWELEPVSLWEAVRTSLFHNPYELYKMTSLNPDCSSAEIEVDTNAMLDSGAIEVSNQSRLGSFNYMDPWITPERHFLYDVLPCAVYAVSKQPTRVYDRQNPFQLMVVSVIPPKIIRWVLSCGGGGLVIVAKPFTVDSKSRSSNVSIPGY